VNRADETPVRLTGLAGALSTWESPRTALWSNPMSSRPSIHHVSRLDEPASRKRTAGPRCRCGNRADCRQGCRRMSNGPQHVSAMLERIWERLLLDAEPYGGAQ
jgi:hypothetical protein